MADELAKPAPQQTWVEKFVAKARGEIQAAPHASPAAYVREAGSAIGEYAGGAVVGGMLGAAHAKIGLDTRHGPIDGWIAGVSGAMAVALSGYAPEAAAYFRKAGAQAMTVFSFRKGYEVVKHEALPGGSGGGVQRITIPGKGPGVTGEDPIEAVAKGLG